jgi:hypothetical protein
MGWVQKNLNDNKDNPLEGRYSVQLIYDWSSYRLIITFCVPLLLSLVLGFWYMAKTGDVVTAWTISLYVVTAAAGKLETFGNLERRKLMLRQLLLLCWLLLAA